MQGLPKVMQQASESECGPGNVSAKLLCPHCSPPHPGHQGDTRSEFPERNWIWMDWIKLDSTWRAAWPDWHQAPEDQDFWEQL